MRRQVRNVVILSAIPLLAALAACVAAFPTERDSDRVVVENSPTVLERPVIVDPPVMQSSRVVISP